MQTIPQGLGGSESSSETGLNRPITEEDALQVRGGRKERNGINVFPPDHWPSSLRPSQPQLRHNPGGSREHSEGEASTHGATCGKLSGTCLCICKCGW